MSVLESYELNGMESFPVTASVRDQLADLLTEGPGRQFDALARAIMTTALNLELDLMNTRSDLIKLKADTMNVYTNLIDLESRIRESGVRLVKGDLEPIDFL